ncbi:MAG: hypothetical protein NTW96_12375 [Planctomycetia bacterium]|nr:hypothetical protein [Planctomycetia bacterium]
MRRPRMAPRPSRSGYTLVEMMMSVLLALIMMVIVVQIFALVGRSVGDSRSALEMTSQTRSVASRLREDLQSLTVEPMPPARPEENPGYFEYIEGPIGPGVPPEAVALNTDEKDAAGVNFLPDTTPGDTDDILMLTVRSRGEPFVGRVFVKTVGGEGEDPTGPFGVQRSAQSPLAEVAWFVRGRTLYRRVLLILPDLGLDLRQPPAPGDPWSYTASLHYDTTTPPELGFYGNYYESRYKDVKDNRFKGFYNNFDLSVRLDKPIAGNPATWRYVPNTLADLTKPENRFAHQPWITNVGAVTGFPFSPHVYFDGSGAMRPSDWRFLGLPTLRECSHFLWPAADSLPNVVLGVADPALPPNAYSQPRDLWNDPLPYTIVGPSPNTGGIDQETGTLRFDQPATTPPMFMGPRVAEDVMLTNVIGFDIKAWDPNAPLLQKSGQAVVLAPGDPGYPTLGPFTAAQLAKILNNNDQPTWTVVGRGAYVDLNYSQLPPAQFATAFSGPPAQKSGLQGVGAGVYDTWSTHYEHDGINQKNPLDPAHADLGTNGFDDNNDGVVDDPGEMDTSPPYPVPLRGIQVRIRVFEPDSRQIREVTITQDFLPE